MGKEKDAPTVYAAENIAPTQEREATLAGIATQLVEYSLNIQPGDAFWIRYDSTTGTLAQKVLAAAEKIGADCRLSFFDGEIDKLMVHAVGLGRFAHTQQEVSSLFLGKEPTSTRLQELAKALSGPEAPESAVLQSLADADFSPQELQQLYLLAGRGSDHGKFLTWSNKVLTLASRKNLSDISVDAALNAFFTKLDRVLTNFRVNERRWCLFRPPTQEDAEMANLPFEVYEQRFYEACNRPWEAVDRAQHVLVEILKSGRVLTVEVPPPAGMEAKWRTHISMEIEGKVAAASGALRNFPGSETYLSPNIHTLPDGTREGTISGTFAIPYPLMLKDRVLPNLILHLEKGRVVRFETDGTDADREHVQKILDTDAGASWIGEIGIGTNPVLDFPVLNTLLVEKLLGVHLALGNAYSYTTYMGEPVAIDNGNRSDIHIDISRVMSEKWGGGQILLDGKVLFENGAFTDPRLAVLNE